MTSQSGRSDLPALAGWLAVTFVAAAIGSVATFSAGEFYLGLSRPAWAPPPSVFGPVWTTLYLMMAVAAWLVWRSGGFAVHRRPLVLYLVQLAVNALWSWTFFSWRSGLQAMIVLVALWLMIIPMAAMFRRANRLAGALIIPYILWVTFAGMLNYATWRMNPGVLGG